MTYVQKKNKSPRMGLIKTSGLVMSLCLKIGSMYFFILFFWLRHLLEALFAFVLIKAAAEISLTLIISPSSQVILAGPGGTETPTPTLAPRMRMGKKKMQERETK